MLKVYVSKNCPFCRKVMKFVIDNHIEDKVHYVDRADAQVIRYLLDTTGRKTVPYLEDGDVAMHESNDIIAYIKKKFL